jgi:hypothetical protein
MAFAFQGRSSISWRSFMVYILFCVLR